MTDRKNTLSDFISRNDLNGVLQNPLPADASFRRYIRLTGGREPLMVMDAAPFGENMESFVKIAAHLNKMGFSAPQIRNADIANGFLLIEDFGDDTFNHLLGKGVDEKQLYFCAIDLLAALHCNPANTHIDLPAYDSAVLIREATLLTQWYQPEVTGQTTSTEAQKAYENTWQEILDGLPTVPETLVLRDFHIDNLMFLENRKSVANCGLLDFQDALIGPAAYDVMSLLEDARRDVTPDLQPQLLARYFQKSNCPDETAFMRWYAALAVQRHAKVAGIFLRLFRRDGKNIYLAHVPRVIRLLSIHLENPDLAPLARWFDRFFPDFKNLPEICRI